MDLYNSWLIFLFLTQTGFCSAQTLLPAEVSGVRGKSVNFTASVPPSTEIETATWTFSPKPGVTVPIYTATKVSEKVFDGYKDRVMYYRSSSTLQLSALTPSDKGTYSLTIVDNNLNTLPGQTVLQVLEPVADVSIISNLPEAVEFNNTVILTCSAKGSSLSYIWLNNSVPVVFDGKHIVQNGSQLIINEVFRNDLLGPITCTAKNQLETSTSDGFSLIVNYGPELVTKALNPTADVLKKGSNLTLSCSAKSSPAAEFMWLFNGDSIPQTNGTVVILNLNEGQSGNYTCMAYNSKTQRYVSTDVSKLTVIEAISGTKISVPSFPLISGNSSVNLTCTSELGKADSVLWTKDGKPLAATNRIIFNADQSTVTILTVQREDIGDYKCQLKNKISSETTNYTLKINYGPENVAINGDKQAVEGQTVIINCSFASVPTPTFVWKFNNSIMIGEANSCVIISNFAPEKSGIYTCEAFNNVTGLRKTANHNLTLKGAGAETQTGLSNGAVAAIVIAVLLLLAIIIGCCIHKKRKVADVPSPY